MLHSIIEVCPFLSGILIGTILFMTGRESGYRLKAGLTASVLAGVACSVLAGEMTGPLLRQVACVAVDSGMASAGWLVAQFALRRWLPR
jgi:hypothetical protein